MPSLQRAREVLWNGSPSFGVVRSPAVQKEEWVWILRSLASTLARTCAASSWLDASGAVVMRRKVRRETLVAPGGEACSMRCRDGGLLRRPSPRSRVRRSGPRCSARCRPNMCDLMSRRRRTTIATPRGSRKRRPGRQSALCRTGRARTSLTCRRFIDPETELVGERTAPDQSVARHSAGARDGRAAGQAEARAVPGRADG